MDEFKEYKSILNVFARDDKTHKLIPGQYCIPEVKYLKDCDWYFTEKVNGTNIRCIITNDTLRIRGRRDNSELPPDLIDNIHALLDPRLFYIRQVFNSPICLRGEGYGAGIHKGGGLYRKDKSIIFFDLEYKEDHYLYRKFFYRLVEHGLKLPCVPVIGGGPLETGIKLVSKGLASVVAKQDRYAEGLVARPSVPVLDRYANKIVVKIKHRDFYKGITKNNSMEV